jgi:hypothetical protein
MNVGGTPVATERSARGLVLCPPVKGTMRKLDQVEHRRSSNSVSNAANPTRSLQR